MLYDGQLPAPTAPLEQPLMVGNYELFRVLGEGGIATTYLGRHLGRGQLYAVKALQILRTKNRPLIELFEREADALRAIHHDQIPSFFETLVMEGSESLTLYLIQEYVEGRSLHQLMAGGHRFTPAQVVAVLLSCLSPLEYLHGLEPPLYHRDLKPSNIIVRPDGACVLVDFGAVREALADPKVAGSSVVGTFGYMAPEQFQARVGPASDLYALGATALHMLSGRAPTDFPVRRLKPDFHASLEADPHLAAIIDLLLEPVAEDRYQSTHSLRRALERWIVDHPEDYDRAVGDLSSLPARGLLAGVSRPSPPEVDYRGEPRRPAVTKSPIIVVEEPVGAPTAPAPQPDHAPNGDGGVEGAATLLGFADARSRSDAGRGNAGARPGGADTAPAAGGAPASRPPAPHPAHPQEMPALSRGLVERAQAGPGGRGRAPEVPIQRTADSLLRLLDPFAPGYGPMGVAWLALAVVVAAVVRVRPVLAPGGWAVAGVLALYGLIYGLGALRRRSHARRGGLMEPADGTLSAIRLRTTVLGDERLVLNYEFKAHGRAWKGRQEFPSRQAAQPFLRRDLWGMVWYDESDPRRSALELPEA